jgi:hypothetical protein
MPPSQPRPPLVHPGSSPAHVVANPVEQIGLACRRLERIAAVRAGLRLAVPAVTALALAAALDSVGRVTWERMGYVMASASLLELRLAFLSAGLIMSAACVSMAWIAYRRADDFLGAAERVDDVVGGRQEIVTLASLADPEIAGATHAQKTPLFPILWQRASRYLERFDPSRAFAFEIRRPMIRSLPIAAALVIALAAAAMALVSPPSANQLEARRLRTIANEMSNSPEPGSKELASKILAAAAALENPKLPPNEKIAKLNDLMRELEKQRRSSSANGGRQGKGSGNGSSGQGTGQGVGSGQGNGPGQGQNPKGPKRNQQIVELQNDISKAKTQLETESAPKTKEPKPGQSGAGNALKVGKNPNEKGPSKEPNQTGQANLPKPGARGQSPSSAPRNAGKDKGGKGDTHLGEFPAPEKFERYTLGKGPTVEVRDARYVLFRLPTDVVSSNGGKLVRDNTRPTATVPYANVPLRAERLEVAPDERQLVPPRYRDLIH